MIMKDLICFAYDMKETSKQINQVQPDDFWLPNSSLSVWVDPFSNGITNLTAELAPLKVQLSPQLPSHPNRFLTDSRIKMWQGIKEISRGQHLFPQFQVFTGILASSMCHWKHTTQLRHIVGKLLKYFIYSSKYLICFHS